MRTLHGGSGSNSFMRFMCDNEALHNDTSVEYEVHSAYPTQRNGQADRIVVGPGEVIVKARHGSAYDFSKWYVGTLEEMTERGFILKSLQSFQKRYKRD